jgi:hypothetical protein
MEEGAPVAAERLRSGPLTAILAAAHARATAHSAAAVGAAGVCLLALLFALPWIWSGLEESNPISMSDRTVSRRTAMVEGRGIVPILLLPFVSGDGADAATRNIALSLT